MESRGVKINVSEKGKDSIIEVPLGTIVKDAETMAVEAEILEDGQELI